MTAYVIRLDKILYIYYFRIICIMYILEVFNAGKHFILDTAIKSIACKFCLNSNP